MPLHMKDLVAHIAAQDNLERSTQVLANGMREAVRSIATKSDRDHLDADIATNVPELAAAILWGTSHAPQGMTKPVGTSVQLVRSPLSPNVEAVPPMAGALTAAEQLMVDTIAERVVKAMQIERSGRIDDIVAEALHEPPDAPDAPELRASENGPVEASEAARVE